MAFFSSNSADYARAIQSLVKPTYQSKYGNVIEDQLNKILNRESFSYDFNPDPLYQNYKDQYTKLGKEAAMNAAAATSTLTGGYGNSYAGTTAAQANQQYLTQLNERIPELYNAALSKYKMETEDMYNRFNTVQSEENRLYGQYRDQVSDYYSDLSDLRGGHSVAQNQENANRDFNYKVGRDSVSDNQWAKQFEYQKSRDAVADSQWQKEYELALKKARSSGGSGGGSSRNNNNTANVNTKINTSSQRFITNDKDGHLSERAETILRAAQKSDDPLSLLEKVAASDSSFTMGDLQYFMERLGLV